MSRAVDCSDGWRKKLMRWVMVGRFAAVHLVCLAVLLPGVGITWSAVGLFFALYTIRLFGVTAGYHRYFSHRTYKMNRFWQFVMAFLAQMSAQKGVLWWASHHRHHHTHSDDPDDVHSPRHHGFWYAHVGWLFDPDWADTDDKRVKDLSRYPELVWLDKYSMLPPTVLGVSSWLFFGWSGLIVGFFWSTVALYHMSFTINSVAHVVGDRRYDTDDDSRNNWLLALLLFGEGWHNNHHHYQASAAQGFRWWEYDISYYILKALEAVGIVYDVRTPPEHVIEDEPHPAVAERQDEESDASDADDGPSVEGDAEGAELPEQTPSTEGLSGGVRQIQLSAARAQEEASRKVETIKLAATKRYDELSDKASQQYQEVSRAASEKVDDLRESARAAQEQAEKKVDEIVDSLGPNPETT